MGLGAGRTVCGRQTYEPMQHVVELEQLIRADAILGQWQIVGQQHALHTCEWVEQNKHANADAPLKSCTCTSATQWPRPCVVMPPAMT